MKEITLTIAILLCKIISAIQTNLSINLINFAYLFIYQRNYMSVRERVCLSMEREMERVRERERERVEIKREK